MAKTKKRLIFLVFSLLILSILYFITKKNSCPDLDCLIFPGKDNWDVKEIYEKSDNGWRGLLTSSENIIRVEKVSQVPSDTADTFTKTRLMQVQGLFNLARSPYPGVISGQIACSGKYKPVDKTLTATSGIKVTYFQEYLNDRMQYGTCLEEEVKFVAYVAIFYCGNTSEWYQIELITPGNNKLSEEKYTSIFKSIECQRPFLNIDKLFP